ncbi:WD40/YVTN/BNR-like repeat-containing protein [Marinobacterium mangrovicola]|uniref:Photosystem II stability/assembly factor-like uncharacterized protein n=1 Tax=Marinobacterium mangrovicola TaxID=1476959 RepID=A0A4R1G8E9_9GAMM|nr:YCF48-related protein [Marinobacterium mangrovicola]TCK02941.1 photosystem II stability/assembly factor-like uncharacterized protein [Marinobacterium mangrovicola]
MRLNSSNFPRVLMVAVLLSATSGVALGTEAVVEPLARSAIEVGNPQGAFMIGVARAGSTIVAVGERGLVLLSDDNGTSWRQGKVPVSTGLTALRFIDDQVGMAVGHAGVVLGTEDGGETWQLLFDGKRAAKLALESAEKSGDERAVWEAQRLVDEGADKPFLDLLLLSPEHAIVVGAYGLAYETSDGGGSWHPIMSRMANPEMSHFYALRKRGDRLVAVGERGLVSLSEDGGVTWAQIHTPYSGSFFTVELPSDESIVAAGLKGNVWRSDDSGDTWTSLPNPIDASITSSLLSASGELLLGSQAGVLLELSDGRLKPAKGERFPPINTFAFSEDQLVLLTMEGVRVSQVDR